MGGRSGLLAPSSDGQAIPGDEAVLRKRMDETRGVAAADFATWLEKDRAKIMTPIEPADEVLALTPDGLTMRGKPVDVKLPEGLEFEAKTAVDVPNVDWIEADRPFSLAVTFRMPAGEDNFTVVSQIDPRSTIDKTVSGVFARKFVYLEALLVLLAAVGVYGLMSHSVSERTREIGIRVALGAQPRQVLLRIIREGLVLALLGIGAGLGGALLAGRVITSFLYGVGSADPLTLAAVAVLLLAVALAASYIPSRRALRVDPIAALRAD